MLVFGHNRFAAHARWAMLAAGLTAGAVGWYAVEATSTRTLPGGGTRVGLILGAVGAAIILFEMLLWPRKRLLRSRTRPWGRTQTWMKAHIWLGLACVPVAALHAGFRLGGPLPAALMLAFALVIVSGVWGLVLQHVIPRRLLDVVTEEVPAAEIDRVVAAHTAGFARRLAVARGEFGGEAVAGAERVREAFEKAARPYLTGAERPAGLRVADRAARWFTELAAATPADARPLVAELEQLCTLRRQLDTQARLHWWLHNWVWVHLPLSVALVGLLVAHIYTALRYI